MIPTIGFNARVSSLPKTIVYGEIVFVTDAQLVVKGNDELVVFERKDVTVNVEDHVNITQHVGLNKDGSIGTVLHIPTGGKEDDEEWVAIGHQPDGTADMVERFCIVTSSGIGGLDSMEATPMNLLTALADSMGFKLVPLSQTAAE